VNFRQNKILSYTKDFSKKNDPNSPDFENFSFQIARFLWEVPVGSQYRRILFFLYFHISM
jgi:hypothetical protein